MEHKLIMTLSFAAAFLIACGDDSSTQANEGSEQGSTNHSASGEVSYGTLVDDRDGQTYKTTNIGNLVWMAENLNYDYGEGSFCYDNDPSNCERYGRLYTARAAGFSCPGGWRLPSKEEFETLIENVGKKNLQAKGFGSGTDPYGFSVLPAGSYSGSVFGEYFYDGKFTSLGESASFWSSTGFSGQNVYKLGVSDKNAYIIDSHKDNAFSVRCLKD